MFGDRATIQKPPYVGEIERETEQIGFDMSCDTLTGAFLRTLAASKPNGSFLELGTGAGVSTCWILDGMSDGSTLTTVEHDDDLQAIAKKYLGQDSRVEFITGDGAAFIQQHQDQKFDFIFADTWPGKFYLLDEVLKMLKIGGFFIVDDLLPNPAWPEEHKPKVAGLVNDLEDRDDLMITKMEWSTGLIIATKTR